MTETYTPTAGHSAGRIDISQTKAPSFLTTTMVEARKLVDTRSAKWLLICIFAGTALVLGIMLWADLYNNLDLAFKDYTQGASMLLSILLPIVAVLLVTSEWGQRTGMVTFALEPHRIKVIFAKWAASLGVAVVAGLATLAMAAGTAAIAGAGGSNVDWEYSPGLFFGYLAVQLLAVTAGFAMACLFLNAAAAIILYLVYIFVLPSIIQIGAMLVGFVWKIAPWIDFNQAQMPLLTGEPGKSLPNPNEGMVATTFSWGESWAHLAVAGFIWLVIPTVIGLLRILKAEVK